MKLSGAFGFSVIASVFPSPGLVPRPPSPGGRRLHPRNFRESSSLLQPPTNLLPPGEGGRGTRPGEGKTLAIASRLVLSTWLLFALALAAPAKTRSEPPLVAPHRDKIKLDGDFKDWRGIAFICVTPRNGVFDEEAKTTADANDLSFRFAVCHDDDALYVAVVVKDNAVWADSTPPDNIEAPAWDDDAIEIFIDGNHNRAPDARALDGAELRFGGEFFYRRQRRGDEPIFRFSAHFRATERMAGRDQLEKTKAGQFRLDPLRISTAVERHGWECAARPEHRFHTRRARRRRWRRARTFALLEGAIAARLAE